MEDKRTVIRLLINEGWISPEPISLVPCMLGASDDGKLNISRSFKGVDASSGGVASR